MFQSLDAIFFGQACISKKQFKNTGTQSEAGSMEKRVAARGARVRVYSGVAQRSFQCGDSAPGILIAAEDAPDISHCPAAAACDDLSHDECLMTR